MSGIKLTSKELWEALNEHFNDNPEFAKRFNVRKATEKRYYVLKNERTWLHVQHRPDDGKLYVEGYFFEQRENYDNMFAHKKEVEDYIGDELEWYISKGKNQTVKLYYKNFDPYGDIEYFVSLIPWIQEKALAMRHAMIKWAY